VVERCPFLSEVSWVRLLRIGDVSLGPGGGLPGLPVLCGLDDQ